MGFSPSSSHASGGLPSQWTDGGNGNVIATVDNASKVPFTVRGAHNENDDIFAVQSFGGTYAFEASGDTSDGVGVTSMSGSDVTVFARAVAGRLYAGGSAVVFFGATAAPADGLIGSSEFALWLDATPAATKLMVKAKDSGGTVRTAAIALA